MRQTNRYKFIPLSLPYDNSIPNASKRFAKLLKQHVKIVSELDTITILGLDPKLANTRYQGFPSFKSCIESTPEIHSLEKTPGTREVGKWVAITKKNDKEEAEKTIKDQLDAFFHDKATEKFNPRMVQNEDLDKTYVQQIIDCDDMSTESDMESTRLIRME